MEVDTQGRVGNQTVRFRLARACLLGCQDADISETEFTVLNAYAKSMHITRYMPVSEVPGECDIPNKMVKKASYAKPIFEE